MNALLAALVLLSPAKSLASGGFECRTIDGRTAVSGIYGSAGAVVNEVRIDGRRLLK
jgi:hypothetical protein